VLLVFSVVTGITSKHELSDCGGDKVPHVINKTGNSRKIKNLLIDIPADSQIIRKLRI